MTPTVINIPTISINFNSVEIKEIFASWRFGFVKNSKVVAGKRMNSFVKNRLSCNFSVTCLSYS